MSAPQPRPTRQRPGVPHERPFDTTGIEPEYCGRRVPVTDSPA
jgi:hypothetical protein